MKKKIFYLSLFLILSIMGRSLHASPFVSIGEGGDQNWTAAMPNIQPATSLSYAANEFYNTQIGEEIGTTGQFVTDIEVVLPNLQPFNPVNDGNEDHDSLVMSWDDGEFGDTTLVVAAWEYVYPADPDLSGLMVHFSAWAPTGVWDLSLELIDVNGFSRGWFQGHPGNLWTNYWLNVDINPLLEAGNPQGPFNAFIETPGFDLTQVVSIRLNESSINNPGMAFIDVDPTTGFVGPFNAWNHLIVAAPTPEPSTIGLALLGLFSLGFALRRARRR